MNKKHRHTYRWKILLLLNVIATLLSCNSLRECNFTLSNNYIDIPNKEMLLLNKMNNLIITHFEDLEKYVHYNDTDPFSMSAYQIRKNLQTDSSEFGNAYDKFDSVQNQKKGRHLSLTHISINPKDTTIDYEVIDEMCRTNKPIIIWHNLLYNANSTRNKDYKPLNLIKEKMITPNWLYYIRNEEYLGR